MVVEVKIWLSVLAQALTLVEHQPVEHLGKKTFRLWKITVVCQTSSSSTRLVKHHRDRRVISSDKTGGHDQWYQMLQISLALLEYQCFQNLWNDLWDYFHFWLRLPQYCVIPLVSWLKLRDEWVALPLEFSYFRTTLSETLKINGRLVTER